MTENEHDTVVAQLPTPPTEDPWLPTASTWLVWSLWVASLGALAVQVREGVGVGPAGLVAVDGLTVTMWVAVTFFSGIVHSYSRRYLAGSRTIDRFFGHVLAFTVAVMVLVAANNVVLFGAAWLAMGLAMASLIGHAEGWPEARAAATLARRYFVASGTLLAVAFAVLWWGTGATTVTGIASATGSTSSAVVSVAAASVLLAAMVQSALIPFHTWLLSSMTAPTPASALMHAGFVNAGGVLLVRFAPIITVDPGFMIVVVLVGAASALGGKLLKTVQTDIKGKLGCSTVGQMGFMIMQAGLGFFAAAITHLVLHGFYKAYQFLSSGSHIEHERPTEAATTGSVGPVGVAVIGVTALAAGVLFAALTGKGTKLDSGLLLTTFVVLTVSDAARRTVGSTALSAPIRYGAVPAVALPAIAVYGGVYRLIEGLLSGLPAVGRPAELTALHGVVAVAFVAAYFAIERRTYQHSRRLYVALLNATQPPSETLLTSAEEYDEH